MSLIKWAYDKLHPAEPTPQLSTTKTQAEASEALQKANTELGEIIQHAVKVQEIARELIAQRERNHFADLVEASMRKA